MKPVRLLSGLNNLNGLCRMAMPMLGADNNMRNPLSFRVESWVGGVLVLGFSAFMVGLFLIALKNFNSNVDIMNASGAHIRPISPQEKMLIDQWLQDNNTGLSVQEVGYRYILNKFPDRPWLTGK